MIPAACAATFERTRDNMSYGSFEWPLKDWSTGRGVERRSERFSVGGHN